MKLRLSKTTLIFLAIGIFVILAAGLGMAYSQQRQEQSRLDEEIALAQLRLEKLPSQQEISSQKEELESRLTKAEAQLKAAKVSLHQSPESIEATDTLFVLAQNSNVEVIEVSSKGLGTETLEEVSLSVLPLIVTIEGDVLNLIDFIYQWTKEYPTGEARTVEISVPEAIEEGAEEEEEEEEIETEEKKPSAIIYLLIYCYEGD